MRAAIGFTIAFLGFAALGWAMYRQRDDSKVPIVIGFGLYALIFALGVTYYGEGTLSSIKGGPGGLEISVTEAKKEIQKTGTEVRAEVVDKIRSDVDELKRGLESQTAASNKTLNELKAIEQRFAPRQLIGLRRERFIARLRAAGPQTIRSVAFAGDWEVAQLMTSIRNAITEAGWQILQGVPQSTRTGAALGINLVVADINHLTQIELTLKEAIELGGLSPHLVDSRDPTVVETGEQPVELVVGSKPQ